jgi:hypothetical protein
MTISNIFQPFITIVMDHFTLVKKLVNLIYYYYLHIEEQFIIGKAHIFSVGFTSLVYTRSREVKKATRKLNRANKKHIQKKDYCRFEQKKAIFSDQANCGIPLPNSISELNPEVVCFMVAELSALSILAIPLCQVILIAFAPFWIMLGVFLIPPFLISYCIITAVCAIVSYLDGRSVKCDGLENNTVIS